MRPSGRRGRTISSSARGAKQPTYHGPLERLLDGHRSRSAANLRNRKSAADLRSQPIRNLGVPGNCFNVTGLGIAPKRVRAPLALQIAAVMTQMPQQRTAFHSTVTVSRVTPFGRPRSASARRSRRIRAIAAARLFRAAAFVRPCPFAPGTSAQYATNHLPSRSIIAVNSFRMAPLYRARALAPWPSNGEVEGPGTRGRERRGRTISQRPRRQTASASRTPPTIVRARLATWTPLPLARDAVVVPVHLHVRAMRQEVLRLGT